MTAPDHFAKTELNILRRRGPSTYEYETALALNRNSVDALQGLGWCKLDTGPIDEVIPLVDQAIRLSPRNPRIGNEYQLVGTVYLLQSRTDEAIIWLEKARS